MEVKTVHEIIVCDKGGRLLLSQSFDNECSVEVIKKTWPYESEERMRVKTVYSNLDNIGKIELNAEIDGVDEAIKKVSKLIEALKKAKSLADDLASMDLKISLCE